jgi:hypothetical protein
MSRDEISRCKDHVRAALCIMEEVADAQPEVHVLISLRELLDDFAWLEAYGESSANVVRLSDVKHLRAIGVSAAAE